MAETSTAKACISCGKALNGQPRMRDSQGRYWCIECGKEDQRKKQMSSGGGTACGGCGDQFPAHQLSKFGAQKLCSKCIRARTKGPGLMATVSGMFKGGGGGKANTGKLYKLIALMILLALIAAYVNL